MKGPRPLIVRKTLSLESEQVGTLVPGSTVRVVEARTMGDGMGVRIVLEPVVEHGRGRVLNHARRLRVYDVRPDGDGAGAAA